MNEERPDITETFRAHVCSLVARNGDSSNSLAKKAGMPQRTVWAVLHTKQKITLEQAQSLSRVYGFEAWDLLMPTIPDSPRKLHAVLSAYLKAGPDDRAILDLIASRYSAS